MRVVSPAPLFLLLLLCVLSVGMVVCQIRPPIGLTRLPPIIIDRPTASPVFVHDGSTFYGSQTDNCVHEPTPFQRLPRWYLEVGCNPDITAATLVYALGENPDGMSEDPVRVSVHPAIIQLHGRQSATYINAQQPSFDAGPYQLFYEKSSEPFRMLQSQLPSNSDITYGGSIASANNTLWAVWRQYRRVNEVIQTQLHMHHIQSGMCLGIADEALMLATCNLDDQSQWLAWSGDADLLFTSPTPSSTGTNQVSSTAESSQSEPPPSSSEVILVSSSTVDFSSTLPSPTSSAEQPPPTVDVITSIPPILTSSPDGDGGTTIIPPPPPPSSSGGNQVDVSSTGHQSDTGGFSSGDLSSVPISLSSSSSSSSADNDTDAGAGGILFGVPEDATIADADDKWGKMGFMMGLMGGMALFGAGVLRMMSKRALVWIPLKDDFCVRTGSVMMSEKLYIVFALLDFALTVVLLGFQNEWQIETRFTAFLPRRLVLLIYLLFILIALLASLVDTRCGTRNTIKHITRLPDGSYQQLTYHSRSQVIMIYDVCRKLAALVTAGLLIYSWAEGGVATWLAVTYQLWTCKSYIFAFLLLLPFIILPSTRHNIIYFYNTQVRPQFYYFDRDIDSYQAIMSYLSKDGSVAPGRGLHWLVEGKAMCGCTSWHRVDVRPLPTLMRVMQEADADQLDIEAATQAAIAKKSVAVEQPTVVVVKGGDDGGSTVPPPIEIASKTTTLASLLTPSTTPFTSTNSSQMSATPLPTPYVDNGSGGGKAVCEKGVQHGSQPVKDDKAVKNGMDKLEHISEKDELGADGGVGSYERAEEGRLVDGRA